MPDGYILPQNECCPPKFIFKVFLYNEPSIIAMQVIPAKVPQFKEFKLERLIEETKTDQEVWKHKSDLGGTKQKYNRQYLETILSTLRPQFIVQINEHAH